jgi:nucleotide-binding universal stress UspA family protein
VDGRGAFREIVIGTDGSDEARLALRLALRLRGDAARVLAVSVAEVHHAYRTRLEAADWINWLREAAEEARLDAVSEMTSLEGAETRVVEGRAAEVLLKTVEERKADLLAVGSGRFSRAAGLVFGSTATRVIREAPCSVLVARGELDPERFPERIVVGIDGSGNAADAEALALALADPSDAHLRRLMATGGGEQLDQTNAVKAELDARAPVDALVDASREAELVIVGSRGLRGLASLGSVAERVAHRAECPVLIVRAR